MKGDDRLERKKRMNGDGEWEHLCVGCDEWLDKSKFRGCKAYVDAYGNCLVCMSCRAKNASATKLQQDIDGKEHLLQAIGFYDYPNAEAWLQAARKKHGL